MGEIIMLMRGISGQVAHRARRRLDQVGRRTATRCAARRSASSATATSARSSACSPKRSACGCVFYDVAEQAGARQRRSPAARLDELLAPVRRGHACTCPTRRRRADMIGADQLAAMKPGCIPDQRRRAAASSTSTRSPTRWNPRHLLGAAIDVFPEEPAGDADEFVSPACATCPT